MSSCISAIDIGNLEEFSPVLTYGLPEEDIKPGNFRSCVQYILRLPKFYLHVNKSRKDKLKCVSAMLFVLAFGGDAAPGYGTSYLVSFLNAGRRVMSSSENFIIFGGNVDETSKISSQFVMKLMTDIRHLESETFDISRIQTW